MKKWRNGAKTQFKNGTAKIIRQPMQGTNQTNLQIQETPYAVNNQ